jgi:hypothetical protein
MELDLLLYKLRSESEECENERMKKEEEFSKLKNKIDIIQEDRRFLYQSAREEKQRGLNLDKRIKIL